MNDIMKSYLSVKQVVQKLNSSVSAKQVYALVRKGKLKANRALGKVLILEESLVALLASGETVSEPATMPPTPRPRGRPKRSGIELW